ncbi:MAG: hypothetical protein LAP86_16560 [Acidobacteriia bacterium]|nr:hypothetical protein [Terriglobia bacterium]
MADQEAGLRSHIRSHIVLIPGFAGFDALGQLEYYSGITSLFKSWRSGNEVLHYFDNFPTAAVATRATRLRQYLAKRIARGEISGHDDITLVGHSTGGLDIRWFLWELHELHDRNQLIVVDGSLEVKPIDLIQRIGRVVFLSVPHWGTNIADWVQAEWLWRKVLIDQLRAMVAGSQLVIADRVEAVVSTQAGSVTGRGFFRAVQDALDEANECNGKQTPFRKAEAHEAAAELALYLRHMASDFRAIDDLTSRAPRVGKGTHRRPMSPAHFTAEDREKERHRLRNIEFRSYATIGRRPFRFDSARPAPVWELTKPWTSPEMSKDSALSAGTDCMYRTCYRACAGGPFDPPRSNREKAKRLSPKQPIAVWDNDGIVNTLSMFWPLGENVLVHADHMDIVGQYESVLADPGGGRKYRRYDLLKSDSGFGDTRFREIWNEIFAFALGRSHPREIRAAKAA